MEENQVPEFKKYTVVFTVLREFRDHRVSRIAGGCVVTGAFERGKKIASTMERGISPRSFAG
jgi:hypothetical protein